MYKKNTMPADSRGAIAAEFATEISKQLMLYKEQEESGDEGASFIVKALALTASSAEKVAAPAFVWSYGLVDIVEKVGQKYAAQPPGERLEWWHHVLTGVVRSDVEVAIRSTYTNVVRMVMRFVHVAQAVRPAASAASGIASALASVASIFASPERAMETLDTILGFVSDYGPYLQVLLEALNRCAVRCVLNVLLKSSKARPSIVHKRATAAEANTGAPEAKLAACNFGVVLKANILLAFNNVVLTKGIAKMTKAGMKKALEFVLPDAKMEQWKGRSWSVYRMLVMHIQSTGGPESVRKKLGDPNATLLADVARTLRASIIVSTPEVLVTFIMKELGAKGGLDLARTIARLALLYTFAECGNHASPFWKSEESVIERAAMLSDSDGNAECVLGRMYHDGHGKLEDKKKAEELYRKAVSAAARVNATHAPALRGLAELKNPPDSTARPKQEREVSEANLVSFAARRYLEEAVGVPLTADKGDGLILRAALNQSALFESATAALIAHYELIVDKQGWYGEKAATAAKHGTMAHSARSGRRLWHQFVMSPQCDRIVGTYVRRELLSIPESDMLGSVSEGLSGYVATMCDLLTSACLFGIRTCLSESYDSSLLGPCLVRDFPSGFAVQFAKGVPPVPRVMGLEFDDAGQSDPPSEKCGLYTEITEIAEKSNASHAFGGALATAATAPTDGILEQFRADMVKWNRLTHKRRVARSARAEAGTGGVPYTLVRSSDWSDKKGDVPCEDMKALARGVIGDIMRVFRYEAQRWAEGNGTVLFAIWKLDAEVQKAVQWILAEFADAEDALKDTNLEPYKQSRFWGVFCVSPFMEGLVDDCMAYRKYVASALMYLAERGGILGGVLSNVPSSLERRVDGHVAAICEIVEVCILAALRSVPYQKLYLVLPFLRHGKRKCSYE